MKKELLEINEMVKGDEIAESLTECLCEYPYFFMEWRCSLYR